MLGDQLRIIPSASTIVDVGGHHGGTTLEYLHAYPHTRVNAFEPDTDNHARATANLGRLAIASC